MLYTLYIVLHIIYIIYNTHKEGFSAIKRIILSEVSQSEKVTFHMIHSHVELKKHTNKGEKKKRQTKYQTHY